jgi:hypothetical protein
MNVVALSGWKGSGKDLVAEYLVEKYGFKRVAFADPLKNTVSIQFNLERNSIENRFLKEAPLLDLPVSPKDSYSRHLAGFLIGEFAFEDGSKPTQGQINSYNFGTGLNDVVGFVAEYGQLYWTRRALCILEGSTKRTADPEYWIKQAVLSMSQSGNYVISDARFKNEIETLGRLLPNSLTNIRIDRFPSSPSTDPSERDLDDFPFPFRINNNAAENKTIEEVFLQVDQIMSVRQIRSLQQA